MHIQRDWLIASLRDDYINRQPSLGELGHHVEKADYLAILTLSHGPWSLKALMPSLAEQGYEPRQRYAMPERGLLLTLMAPRSHQDAWLVMAEFQLATLARQPRKLLNSLLEKTPAEALECPLGPRRWPMPSGETFAELQRASPLAGWLSVMGARVHHCGLDCQVLGMNLATLEQQIGQPSSRTPLEQHDLFPVSPLLEYRYYPGQPDTLQLADGIEHMMSMTGMALLQKRVNGHPERCVELLLPHHARCELA